MIMSQNILIRRGSQADIDSILLGLYELGYTTDTKRLYIGNGLENVLIGETYTLHKNIITTSDVNYYPTDTDFTILCDTSGNHVRVRLPYAADHPGRIFVCKKMDSANRMRIRAWTGETIDGNQQRSYSKNYSKYIVQSDGVAGWWIVG